MVKRSKRNDGPSQLNRAKLLYVVLRCPPRSVEARVSLAPIPLVIGAPTLWDAALEAVMGGADIIEEAVIFVGEARALGASQAAP